MKNVKIYRWIAHNIILFCLTICMFVGLYGILNTGISLQYEVLESFKHVNSDVNALKALYYNDLINMCKILVSVCLFINIIVLLIMLIDNEIGWNIKLYCIILWSLLQLLGLGGLIWFMCY